MQVCMPMSHTDVVVSLNSSGSGAVVLFHFCTSEKQRHLQVSWQQAPPVSTQSCLVHFQLHACATAALTAG